MLQTSLSVARDDFLIISNFLPGEQLSAGGFWRDRTASRKGQWPASKFAGALPLGNGLFSRQASSCCPPDPAETPWGVPAETSLGKEGRKEGKGKEELEMASSCSAAVEQPDSQVAMQGALLQALTTRDHRAEWAGTPVLLSLLLGSWSLGACPRPDSTATAAEVAGQFEDSPYRRVSHCK